MKRYSLREETSFIPAVDYASALNPEQLAAVTAGDGPCLVIAGAGSGKTRVVTYRVAYLMENGVPPSAIMLLTFTNKAAREMLHRVELLIKGDAGRVSGGTFHHMGNMILRRYGESIGLNRGFTILDREDSKSLVESCIAELNLRKDKMFPRGVIIMDLIGYAVGAEIGVADAIELRYPHLAVYAEEVERVRRLYEKKKREMNHLDFDDLLFFWKELMMTNHDLRERLADRYRHVLVDEYQDTNKIQAELVDLVALGHRNLMVVGDDSQSIYSFRGACFDNIIEFPERYPDARIFRLTTNYRSTEEILHLANESISHNRRQFPKELDAAGRNGPLPALVPLKNQSQQAVFIARRILDFMDEGMPLNDIAVLYRSHYQSMDLQMELTRRRIPYEVRSGLRFFEQAHIKDVVSYLRAALNPLDEISWTRILRMTPGIGSVTAAKIWNMVKESGEPIEFVLSDEAVKALPKRGREGWPVFTSYMKGLAAGDVLDRPAEAIRTVMDCGYDTYLKGNYEDYDERREDVLQLANYAGNFSSTEEFLSDLALLTSVQSEDIIDGGEDGGEAVVLSTIHRAKGLEWSRVFVIGLVDGAMPPAKAMDDDEREEEERRVFYVAVTRAKDELYLCYPIMDNRWYDGSIIKRPSIFIQELPPDSYEQWDVEE
jgi:DNA helicase-2/ATP-dependent DNA helicase PcrA